MIDNGYLYSKDNKRIFVNTCLGCNGKCTYCYLGKMGYDSKSTISEIKKAEDLIKQMEQIGVTKNTLITLGCFSECWDNKNKPETIKLIKYFLQEGNQIQLSTKKQMTIEEIRQFKNLIQYLGQLIVFVSSATISKWSAIEKQTESPSKRFKTFEISKELNIPTVLYMKPILKEVTIKDIEIYKDIIKKYDVKDIVVGSIFGEKETNEEVHFSNKGTLFYSPVSDELEIKRRLLELGNVRVFSRSSEVMQYYRDRTKEITR